MLRGRRGIYVSLDASLRPELAAQAQHVDSLSFKDDYRTDKTVL
jgi:hypothetical protein